MLGSTERGNRSGFAHWASLFASCRNVTNGFVEFAHGIEHEIGGGAQHGALRRWRRRIQICRRPSRRDAALDNVDDGFVAEERAAFGVSDFAGIEEKDRVGFAGIDGERAGLTRVAEHLHDAGEIVMGEIAAKAGIRLAEHLRGLKAFGFADENIV